MPITRASNPLDTVVRAKVGNTGCRHSAVGARPTTFLGFAAIELLDGLPASLITEF